MWNCWSISHTTFSFSLCGNTKLYHKTYFATSHNPWTTELHISIQKTFSIQSFTSMSGGSLLNMMLLSGLRNKSCQVVSEGRLESLCGPWDQRSEALSGTSAPKWNYLKAVRAVHCWENGRRCRHLLTEYPKYVYVRGISPLFYTRPNLRHQALSRQGPRPH